MKIHTRIFTLLAYFAAKMILTAEPTTAFRAGDELVVIFDRLDLPRQAHPQLNAELQLHRRGGDTKLQIDLSDPAVQGALIIDLVPIGQCDGLTATVKDQAGKPPSATSFAFIEPGAEMRKAHKPAPRIVLPEANQLREIRLAQPARLVAKKDITFPVVADVDFPLVSNAVTARQTAAPKDPAKASKHAFPTYDGAPSGILTVRYDLIAGIKSTTEARGRLADSLSGGASMAPAFLLSPISGEAHRVMAVCEYAGYPLSVLDFSQLAEKHSVRKSFLPPSVPARTGLGPYNSLWVRHDDEQWLFVSGYGQQNVEPFVRVVTDFIPPQKNPSP